MDGLVNPIAPKFQLNHSRAANPDSNLRYQHTPALWLVVNGRVVNQNSTKLLTDPFVVNANVNFSGRTLVFAISASP